MAEDLEGLITNAEGNGNDGLGNGKNGLEYMQSDTPTTYQRFRNSASNILVDVSAGWLFYLPIVASIEKFVVGMENEEVLKARGLAMGVHGVFLRPYGKFRGWWAKKWDVNSESSSFKKFLVDTTALMLYQIPTYSSVLYLSGASFEEGATALPLGLAVGAGTGRVFGMWLDKWRKIWGKEPTLSK